MTIYNFRGNQIDIAQIAIYNYNCFLQIKSNQMLVFGERVPEEKPLIIKLNPHLMPRAEIEPGPHGRRASALTTKPTLPPATTVCLPYDDNYCYLYVSFELYEAHNLHYLSNMTMQHDSNMTI